MKTVVILNNVRSNENVGSIFRTSDAARVSKIILCGYTPTPTDRFGRENKGLIKASLGAEKFVEWEQYHDLRKLIQDLRIKKYRIVAVEQSPQSVDYKKFLNPKSKILNLALVFGNEVDGLSQEDLRLCDKIIEIPMRGHKESLNVAVAVGVVLFSLS